MRSQGVNKATLFRLAGLQEPKETNQEHTKLSDSTTELRDLDSVADSDEVINIRFGCQIPSMLLGIKCP